MSILGRMDDAAGDDVVSAAAGQKRAAEKSRSRQELEKSESIVGNARQRRERHEAERNVERRAATR
jgi:hypothetical protein